MPLDFQMDNIYGERKKVMKAERRVSRRGRKIEWTAL